MPHVRRPTREQRQAVVEHARVVLAAVDAKRPPQERPDMDLLWETLDDEAKYHLTCFMAMLVHASNDAGVSEAMKGADIDPKTMRKLFDYALLEMLAYAGRVLDEV